MDSREKLTRRAVLAGLAALGLGAPVPGAEKKQGQKKKDKGQKDAAAAKKAAKAKKMERSVKFADPEGKATVLIVADEVPAMEVLAEQLRAEEKVECKIVLQGDMPADISKYAAVVVYIHGKLEEGPELAMVKYTEAGGRLVALHHSISSGKRANKYWYKFLGVDLPLGDVEAGGYKWTEGVPITIVDLNPGHFITHHKVKWPGEVAWQGGKAPGVTLEDSEVYLNHVLKADQTKLLGLKYTDAATGKTWEQGHAGWVKKAGKGSIVYLLPGHSEREFQDPVYARIVMNAVVYKGDII